MSSSRNPSLPPPEILSTVGAADELIDRVLAVRHPQQRGDTAARVMFGAYIKGFRRFVSIRELAARGAGEDAYVLLRSLLSLVARAAWVNWPTSISERRARFEGFQLHGYQEELRVAKEWEKAGMDVDLSDRDEIAAAAQALEAKDVKPMPSDAKLLRSLSMQPYYARIYGPASSHVHFSLDVALQHLVGVESVSLDEPQWEAADEALRLAVIVFGLLLEMSEQYVRHGLADTAASVVAGYLGLDG